MVAENKSAFIQEIERLISGPSKAVAVIMARSQMNMWKSLVQQKGEVCPAIAQDMRHLADILAEHEPGAPEKIVVNLSQDLQR